MSAENPPSRTQAVFLVGPMGVGKSTVGPLLAKRLDRDFIDTDQEVERTEGRTIRAIFEAEGEARFRALEAAAIEGAAKREAVVALGGGAIAQPGAAARLQELGVVIHLRADVATLLARIGDPSSRPLLAGLDAEERARRLSALIEERAEFHAQATHSVDASGEAEAVVEAILALLDRSGFEARARRDVPGPGARNRSGPKRAARDAE